jgi:hypothetical protein
VIPGGNLRDLEALAKHFYYEGHREGKESTLPLVFMGVVTTAIGATMLYHGGAKLWADHVKEQAKAARSRER